MNQERLARIHEMAHEHQLAVLEMQGTPMTFKGWAILPGGIVAGCFLTGMATA